MEFTTGGRLEVLITPSDVGKRVSVRRLNDAVGGVEKFTDAVGVLTSWDAGVLSITRRDGRVVRIAEPTLVAGKVVPAAPARRRGPSASAYELTRVAARAWPATESDHLGEWELRHTAGFTRRANSVLPFGEPGVPLDTALDRVRAWYEERGLPAYIHVTTGAADTRERLGAELETRGWSLFSSAQMRIAALAPVGDLDVDESGVVLTRRLEESWLRRYQRYGRPSPEALPVLSGGPSVWFASVPGDDGAASAIGRLVVDGRWAGFSAVEVDPAARRRGLASAVMVALAREALHEGASAAYLQVGAANVAAQALYDGMGFAVHHSYHYWRAAPAGGR